MMIEVGLNKITPVALGVVAFVLIIHPPIVIGYVVVVIVIFSIELSPILLLLFAS